MAILIKIPDNHNDYRVSLQIVSVIISFLPLVNKRFFRSAYCLGQKLNRVIATVLCPI